MPEETKPFFRRYTDLVTESDPVAAMRQQIDQFHALLGLIPEARANQVDPPYGWTIKQVVQHVIDAERVFGYRALRFARADPTPLPGFDETAYANAVDAGDRDLGSLLEEFTTVRHSHLALFSHLPADAWTRKGTASGIDWTVGDLARAIVGHARHHLQILAKRLGT